jgi:cysteine desulfurase/selenocysteine lyase
LQAETKSLRHLPACADFPILDLRKDGTRLIYLDSAATAQVPTVVQNAITACYRTFYGPVHRSVHGTGAGATAAYEAARSKVASFINARTANEIVFTKSATEGLNLVASTVGRSRMEPGDEVILSQAEHHANIVPWQLLQADRGVVVKFAPLDENLTFDVGRLAEMMTGRTKVIALTHVSNVLGTQFPIREVADLAHAHDALLVVDGAQAVAHKPVDVQDLDADFYVFSGHKLYAGGGIGVLYAKEHLLQSLPPFLGGGGAILSVTEDDVVFKPAPHRYEPGTPPVAEAVALATSIDYLSAISFETITAHEHALMTACRATLDDIDGVTVIGPSDPTASLISFTLDGVHPHDVCTVLDARGVAIRGGHHCAQPLMHRLGLTGTCRVSFALYNGMPDVNSFADGLLEAQAMFR